MELAQDLAHQHAAVAAGLEVERRRTGAGLQRPEPIMHRLRIGLIEQQEYILTVTEAAKDMPGQGQGAAQAVEFRAFDRRL